MGVDKIVIDLKSWDLPKSWDDVTLGQFQQLQGKDDIIDIVSILSNHSRDDVMMLPSELLDLILDAMSFISEAPEQGEPTNRIEIDGETYQVNVMEKLKVGEHIAADTILKADKNNIAAILAVMCRKEGEVYDSKFEAEVFPEREKMFLQCPVTKVLPLCTFFFNCWVQSETLSRLSMEAEEELNRTLRDIENSPNLGRLRKYFLKRQAKALLKRLR